jgi:signal transduction histidine kinase
MKELIASYHGYFLLAAGGVNLAIAVLVLFSGVRNATTYGFLHCTVGIVGYLILYGVMSLTKDMALAMLLTHVSQILINQISPGFYIFSVYFLNLEGQKKWAKISPLFGIVVVFLLFSIPGQSIRSYWWGNFNVYPLPASLPRLIFYYAIFFGFMAVSFRNFTVAYRNEKNTGRRLQIRYVFIAFSIAYLASWDNLPINGIDVYPFGYIPLTLFSLIVLYTIVRFRFLNIQLGIRRMALMGVIYAVLFALVSPVSMPFARTLSSGRLPHTDYGILLFGIGLGLVFSLGPIIYAALVRHSYWLKGHLTQSLTHELKSPLSAIQGSMDILIDELKSPRFDRKKSMDYASMIQSNVERLEAFVKDLLNVARIQEETLELEKSMVNLGELAREVAAHFSSAMKKNSLSVVVKAGQVPPLHVDKLKIEQVISNLLSNAIKFSHEGVINIEVNRNEAEVVCSVVDSGRGINSKHLNRIFDRFYQVDPGAKGSGIGLAIAKAWVEAHGGRIWAESEGEGKGTKVTFTVPV